MILRTIQTLSLAGLLTIVAGLAQAQGGMGGGMGGGLPEFATVDTDGNGLVSKEEMMEVNPDFADRLFAAVDADEDDNLTEEEWNTPRERGNGGGGMGGQ